MGKLDENEKDDPSGVELPSTHFEMWKTPVKLSILPNTSRSAGAGFRETFGLVNSLFDKP
jgi:hypothetical protein